MATFRLTPMASDIIVDASATAAWIFDDENSPYADAVFDLVKINGALVPQFWHIEMRNVPLSGERRNRITAWQADQHLANLLALPLLTDDGLDLATAFILARAYGLSFYDAIYLELARRHNAMLATLDGRLTRAANAEGLFLVV